MTRAAIYARRSTEPQDASIMVQIEEATRFIKKNDWVCNPESVFVDDAISRSEFKKRPGLFAMLNAAESGEIDVVVVRDETRLGGDMLRTGLLIEELLESGVRLFHYSTGEEVTFDNPTQKLVVTIRNYASEIEREKIASRTYEHLLVKARKGLNTGGKVYGYENRKVGVTDENGDEKKLYTQYVINEEETAVVRRIFELYACGTGYRRIARILNADGIPSPRAGRRGTGSWGSSSVRVIICNNRYLGLVPWNRYQKVYRGGTKKRIERPREEWMFVSIPELRIVDDELWERALAQRSGRPVAANGHSQGGPKPKYLLSGLLRCGVCGGPVQAVNTKRGKETIKGYGCSYRRNRGPEVCDNERRRPVDEVDAAVARVLLEKLRGHDLVDQLMQLVRGELVRRQARDNSGGLKKVRQELEQLYRELRRLSDAVASGGEDLPELFEAMRERRAKVEALEAQVRQQEYLDSGECVGMEIQQLEAEARRRLDELADVFSSRPEKARAFLEQAFPHGLVAHPVIEAGKPRWNIHGEAVFDLDIPGVTMVASPAGFELYYT